MNTFVSEKIEKNSNELLKQAKKAAQKYIPPEDDKDRNNLGATLENDQWLQRQLEVIYSKVNINEMIANASPVYLPRFGPLTYLAKTTTFIIFDVPELKEMIATAAVDGMNVWINQDFLEELKALEDSPTSLGSDGVFVLLHELSHKFSKHLDRMYMYTSDIANRAQDYWINSNLIHNFPNYAPSLPLRRSILGANQEDSVYLSMSSESIADMLIRDKSTDPGNGGKGGKGKPGKGGGSAGSGGSSSGGGSSGDPSEDFSFGNSFDEGETHTIDPEKIMETLKEVGLGPIGEVLGYPTEDGNTPEGKKAFDKLDEVNRKLIEDAVFRSSEDREQYGDKTPGAHMEQSLSQKIATKAKGKMDFRAIAPEVLFGDGPKAKHYSDEIGSLYYIEELGDMLGTPGDGIWLGAPLPHTKQGTTINLIDTSGSVSDEELQDAVTLCVDMVLISGNNDENFRVFMASADTIARGEIFEVNDENATELRQNGVEVFGRGGTDFDSPCRTVLTDERIKNTKIHAIIYTTDLGAPVPDFAKMEEDGILDPDTKIFFVATKSATLSMQEEFQAELGTRGRVIPLREGGVLDLDNDQVQVTATSKKRKSLGM